MAFGSVNVPGATKKEVDALQTALNGKSDTNHTHDDRYYTESEINTKLNGKSDTSHTHPGKEFLNKNLCGANIDTDYRENYVVALHSDGYGTRPTGNSGWVTVANFYTNHFIFQIAQDCNYNKVWIRSKYHTDQTWKAWKEVTTDHWSGVLTAPAGLCNEGDTITTSQHALNMNNSNIIGINSLFMNDSSDGAGEGIQWYRSDSHVDSQWVNNGVAYLTVDRTLNAPSQSGTTYTMLHNGNIGTYAPTLTNFNSFKNRYGLDNVFAQNGGDLNNFKDTQNYFVFNCTNVPSGSSYGFLEVFKMQSGGFVPSMEGVTMQRFTSYYNKGVYTRVYRENSWTNWVQLSPNYSGTVDSIALGSNSRSANKAIAIGYVAKTTAEDATAIGYAAEATAKSSAAIGYYASCSTANGIQLGSSSSTSQLSCKVALTVTSDERDKTDIEPISNGALEFLEQIEPIRFRSNHRSLYIPNELSEEEQKLKAKYGLCDYDHEAHAQGAKKGNRVRVGMRAQQVQQALKEVYGDDSYANLVNDNFYDYTDEEKADIPVENQLGVTYENFIPFLIKAVQELSQEVKEIKAQIK